MVHSFFGFSFMALHHSGEPTSGVQADINVSNARADIKRFITDSKL